MKKLLLVFLSLTILSAVSSLAHEYHHFCATSLFQAEKVALSEAFDRSLHGERPLEKGLAPQVGDTMTFWAWDFATMPPPWILVPATCRAVGEYCYVFVDDDQWNVNMDSADVSLVVERFDHSTPADPARGIYEINTETFGPPPDELDQDPKIYIFYSALGCFMGSCFDGYFSVFNEYTEEEARTMGGHSNEVEMFYMSCEPINPTANSTLSVLAHEFEHMIHWNMDPDEASWVDEGCAEYAMYLYGYPDPVTGFPQSPDDNLIVWDNSWIDYIQTYLFLMYFTGHYGGDSAITALVSEQANSIAGVENTLDGLGYLETFEEVFIAWTVANFLDDISIDEGQYGYPRIEIPPFSARRHDTYPVPEQLTTVQHWAADYIRFVDGSPMLLSYDGQDSSIFSLQLLKLDETLPTTVEGAPLDALQAGEFQLPDFGAGYDTLIVVSAHITSAGGKQYAYSTGTLAGITHGHLPADEAGSVRLFRNQPNPFNPRTTILFSLPERQYVRLSVYDASGRLVKELLSGETDAGCTGITWDGLDESGTPVAPGVFYSRLESSNRTLSRRMVLIR
ncbi:FlgD immunoglobulin-like domain containing protein [Candidatus Eisenbacteria bacterium]|uniref:FlgD immunoglobulin-like domain containing protein n=1 Tax=Eiseniibacteriota bacterium TaxID=2212470 RepID=A0ABV6YPN7_UNCEI